MAAEPASDSARRGRAPRRTAPPPRSRRPPPQAGRLHACATLSDVPDLLDEQRRALHASSARRAPATRCSSTGSPAAARPRCTCRRRRPPWRPAARCSCWCPRSALPGRRSRASSAASPGTPVAVLHSGLSAGERLARLRRRGARRGADRRRRALGGVRAAGGPGADRRRRGARHLVQAGERAAPTTPAPLPAGAPPRAAQWSCWARRRRASRASPASRATPTCTPAWTARSRRRWRSWTCAITTACSRRRWPRRSAASSTRGRRPSSSSTAAASRRYLTCDHCGHAWECPHCDVTLTLFGSHTLRCRTCGHGEPAPSACPACGRSDLVRYGYGTERLEREVRLLLPGVDLLRLDSDVAGSYARLQSVLGRFAEPGPKVLVGTQMIAKGHHFPDVTLVGVVNADLTLHFPDFRAEERTFALLVQVGGRSGRGDAAGPRHRPDAGPRGAADRARRRRRGRALLRRGTRAPAGAGLPARRLPRRPRPLGYVERQGRGRRPLHRRAPAGAARRRPPRSSAPGRSGGSEAVTLAGW